ncbi:MAG: AmmeMemoRadiSam system radical SAM enzyme [candidate division Zixibacteria bacterium]
MIRDAAYYETEPDGRLFCRLCPSECRIAPGKQGLCLSRKNDNGRLVTDNYGEVVTMALDPIEKKPLYHFHPGRMILSTGPNCCNLDCRHCQNWSISKQAVETSYCSPEKLVELTNDFDTIGVAFTYTEPLVWFEYLMDTAPLLRQAGMAVVLVSNGYINPAPLSELLSHIDAANIDLKGMRPEFYERICKGKVEPILENIARIAESDVHLELTNLIIPDLNDSDDDLNELFDFVASISADIPLHLSAYHPSYKMKNRATPAETLLRAKELASDRLKYLFLGNISTVEGSTSNCPECDSELVRRNGYTVEVLSLSGGKCMQCGAHTGIVQQAKASE